MIQMKLILVMTMLFIWTHYLLVEASVVRRKSKLTIFFFSFYCTLLLKIDKRMQLMYSRYTTWRLLSLFCFHHGASVFHRDAVIYLFHMFLLCIFVVPIVTDGKIWKSAAYTWVFVVYCYVFCFQACIRNCLTQKDQFIRETSKLKGNYWKLSDDLLRKLRPPDNTSHSESLETASVDRSTWNCGRYVTIAPKRAFSDSGLDGVLNQGALCVAGVINDSYSAPLKSSVLANKRQCSLEDGNLFNAEGEISRISDYSTSCHSLDAIVTQGASFINDISNDSQIVPLKSSVIGENSQCFAEDRNLLNSNLNMRGETTTSSLDRVVTPMELNIMDSSNLGYNTPLKLSLKSNSSVKVERSKILDYSKSCNQPKMKRTSDVLNDENITPVSRKRSRLARNRIPKIKTMHGFRERLDAEKRLAPPEEKLADRNAPCQFPNVNENVKSSSEELRGFKISSVSGERFGTKIQIQFAKSGHQLKDVTNVLRNTPSMEKGRRNVSVARNGENIENQKRKLFSFKTIGEVHSLGSSVSSEGHSKLRSFSTSLLNVGDRHNHDRGSYEAEASTLVGAFGLQSDDRNTVTDLSEIPETIGEATICCITTEISSSETSTAIRSVSLEYDNRNSGESLNECSGDGKGETVGYVTTAITTPPGDDRSYREELTEFSDDEFVETTGEITNAGSPNSDDIGRDEVFTELSNPPELGDTWDNVDLSFLDNLDEDG